MLKPKKQKFIARQGGYHGLTFAAASLTGIPAYHKAWDLPMGDVFHVEREHNRSPQAATSGEWSPHVNQAEVTSRARAQQPGWGDQETEFALSLERWDEWLGMSIDPMTLASIPLPQIAAHCMSEMTFHGFDEADVQAVVDEMKTRVAELDATRRSQIATLHQLSS